MLKRQLDTSKRLAIVNKMDIKIFFNRNVRNFPLIHITPYTPYWSDLNTSYYFCVVRPSLGKDHP